jgi:hypothetical protein
MADAVREQRMDDTTEHAAGNTSGHQEPTDFLAFSRQYAADMGLASDITAWDPGDFQAFLDWWLLRTRRHFVASDSA